MEGTLGGRQDLPVGTESPWTALVVGRDSSPFAQPGCRLRVEAALRRNVSPEEPRLAMESQTGVQQLLTQNTLPCGGRRILAWEWATPARLLPKSVRKTGAEVREADGGAARVGELFTPGSMKGDAHLRRVPRPASRSPGGQCAG